MSARPDLRRMVGAEILKLRRRRQPLLVAVLLSVGLTALYFVVLLARNDGEVDGMRAMSSGTALLGIYFGAFASILIGTEAGTGDAASGVFRDLVATGRSRAQLVLVRIPAAVIVALALAMAGFVLTTIVSFVFQGPSSRLSLGDVASFGAWLALTTGVTASLAASLGSFTGSRSVTLATALGLHTVVTTLLFGVKFLGGLRGGLLLVALSRLRPGPDYGSDSLAGSGSALPGFHLDMPVGIAALVIVAWVSVPVLLATRRANRSDV